MKLCPKCQGQRRNAAGKCVPCYNQFMKEYLARRYKSRREWAISRLGGQCAQCGAMEPLEFDHIEPSRKRVNIPKILLGTIEALELELSKCQLLCSDCHLAKTRVDRGVPHGGGKKGKNNCGCIPCKQRRRVYQRLRRDTIKLLAG